MSLKKFRPVLEITLLSAAAFAVHTLYFYFFGQEKTDSFRYPLFVLYGFFYACAVSIILVLIKIKSKNIDSVGNAFMLLTCVKAVLAYILLHPILQSDHLYVVEEKINFFIVFAVFLALETIVSIRILNKN